MDPRESNLPHPFAEWFAARGWALRPHQRALLDGGHTLLIAPTGGGKTLAGFLPALIELAHEPAEGLYTLYISPLKALAVDVHRNIETPIAEMGLAIRAETRTGDTPQRKRERQRRDPPAVLMTTPESLALLLSYPDAPDIFASLRHVVIDELHALAGAKRGDLLSLGLARLGALAPAARRIGLSATVARPDDLRAWLSPDANPRSVRLVESRDETPPDVSILVPTSPMPWSGHMALGALPAVFAEIERAATTILFVNTRAQAELAFHVLWRMNADNLPIGLHHGSLAVDQRRRIEAAMAAGRLRAVVATSSLDLGVDWGAVDLVVQLGAPKGVSRLIQRIGRAGHRLETASRALVVPGNRFEYLECRAALDGVRAHALDGAPPPPGGLDVLAQHVLGTACAGAFDADALYAEVRNAAPYAALPRADFDDVLGFVENGGYALSAYDRYRRIHRRRDGRWGAASQRVAQRYRMNVGAIVEAVLMRIRLGRGRVLGEIEEHFVLGLTPGDTFVFAGQILEFRGVRENEAIAAKAMGENAKVPAYGGGRLPLTTELADRVRGILQAPRTWAAFPEPVREWLELQTGVSTLPGPDDLLVETFPRGGRHYTVAYCFEGRNAHQTLGMLLTRRMERAGHGPLSFVATDYVLAAWSAFPATDIENLFDQNMLGDDLEEWMAESSMLRRTFRNVGIVSGLIPRNHPGRQRTRRQTSIDSDLIYAVLRRYQPDHILLRATRDEAARGLTDVRRLSDMLARVKGRIVHRALDRVSPLAVPVLLEIGRENVYGTAPDALLDEAAEELIAEAMQR